MTAPTTITLPAAPILAEFAQEAAANALLATSAGLTALVRGDAADTGSDRTARGTAAAALTHGGAPAVDP